MAALAVASGLWFAASAAQAFQPAPADMDTIARSALPPQGQQVLAQIERGGPFRQKRGYYREYTVPTPGLKHRGARRIVCGGLVPQTPDACYYTKDHYASFKLIVNGL